MINFRQSLEGLKDWRTRRELAGQKEDLLHAVRTLTGDGLIKSFFKNYLKSLEEQGMADPQQVAREDIQWAIREVDLDNPKAAKRWQDALTEEFGAEESGTEQ